MKLTAMAFAAALLAALSAAGPVGAEADGPTADLAAARQALEANVALGASLTGGVASPEQAAEAERLYQEALAAARAYLGLHAREAQAHWLVGRILCTAYRPVEVPAEGEGEQPHTVLARGAVATRAEGLAEFRAALRLDEKNFDYMLDYAEAMLCCDDVVGCHQQCYSLWENRRRLSRSQGARCAGLLAATARASRRDQEELGWLQQALALDPKQEDALARVGELLAAQPGVTWLSYEVGRALSAQQQRPLVVDFYADWCGWCKKMEAETFPAAQVAALLHSSLCAKVNGDTRRDLSATYGVNGYPTTLVLHPSGHELARIVGYRPAAEYAAELERALKIN